MWDRKKERQRRVVGGDASSFTRSRSVVSTLTLPGLCRTQLYLDMPERDASRGVTDLLQRFPSFETTRASR